MTLQELSREYRDSAQLCKQRAAELAAQLDDPGLSETQRLLLRRRICILTAMARDTMGVSSYLHTYYRKENEG